MAIHISLTSVDGTMTVVDKSLISSCQSFFALDQDEYERQIKEYERELELWGAQRDEYIRPIEKEYEKELNLWKAKRSEVFHNHKLPQGRVHVWEAENPQPVEPNPEDDFQKKNPKPVRPNPDDFRTNDRLTRIALANKTSIIVKDTTEEVFAKIKETWIWTYFGYLEKQRRETIKTLHISMKTKTPCIFNKPVYINKIV